jgi:hypothetical protein
MRFNVAADTCKADNVEFKSRFPLASTNAIVQLAKPFPVFWSDEIEYTFANDGFCGGSSHQCKSLCVREKQYSRRADDLNAVRSRLNNGTEVFVDWCLGYLGVRDGPADHHGLERAVAARGHQPAS